MDICPPFMKKCVEEGFPQMTEDLVNFVRSPDGRLKLDELNTRARWPLTSIDLLKTMGSTMLHEVRAL